MSEIILSPEGDSVLHVEVVDEGLEVVARFLVEPGQHTVIVRVDPGRYLVRARRPTGATFSRAATVARGDSASVDLSEGGRTPHEWLRTQWLMGEVPDIRTLVELRREAARTAGLGRDTGIWAMDSPIPHTWVRFWGRHEGEWTALEARDRFVAEDTAQASDAARLRVASRDATPTWLQVAGPGGPSRVVPLPPTGQPVDVAIVPRVPPTGARGRDAVRVVVRGLHLQAEALARYLVAGDATAVRVAVEGPSPVAGADPSALLREGSPGALELAVTGYALLRTGDLDRLGDWSGELARQVPWLPDGAVIHATRMLRDPALHDPAAACVLLVDAAGRGLPLMGEGLRLLWEGLELFARVLDGSSPAAPAPLRRKAAAAVEELRPYIAALDPGEPWTTVFGRHPAVPGLDQAAWDARPPAGAVLLSQLVR